MPSRGIVNTAYISAVFCTLIDAVCTFIVIEVYGSATEGNAWLDQLGQAIGFGPAMVIRGVVGISLLTLLYGLTYVKRRGRSLAARGVILAAILLGALALYQAGGIIYSMVHFSPS